MVKYLVFDDHTRKTGYPSLRFKKGDKISFLGEISLSTPGISVSDRRKIDRRFGEGSYVLISKSHSHKADL